MHTHFNYLQDKKAITADKNEVHSRDTTKTNIIRYTQMFCSIHIKKMWKCAKFPNVISTKKFKKNI